MAVSALCLAIALTGVADALLFALARHLPASSALEAWAAFSVFRILAAPPLALAFLVGAVISPYRVPQFAFGAACVMEAVVSLYGGASWFLPLMHARP